MPLLNLFKIEKRIYFLKDEIICMRVMGSVYSLVLARAPGDLVWCSYCTYCDPFNITISNKIIYNSNKSLFWQVASK